MICIAGKSSKINLHFVYVVFCEIIQEDTDRFGVGDSFAVGVG